MVQAGWLGGAAALAVITSFSQDLGSDLPRAAELGFYIVIAFALFLLLTWTIGLALAGILKALTAPSYRRAGATWDRATRDCAPRTSANVTLS